MDLNKIWNKALNLIFRSKKKEFLVSLAHNCICRVIFIFMCMIICVPKVMAEKEF